jgi:hypothetical protein
MRRHLLRGRNTLRHPATAKRARGRRTFGRRTTPQAATLQKPPLAPPPLRTSTMAAAAQSISVVHRRELSVGSPTRLLMGAHRSEPRRL